MKNNYIIIVIIVAIALVCFNLFFRSKPVETKKIEYKRGETKTALTKGETIVTEKWRKSPPVGSKQAVVSNRQTHEAVKVDTVKFADDNLKLSVTLKQDSSGITITPGWEVLEKTLQRIDTLTSARVDTLTTIITLEASVPFYKRGWFIVLEIAAAIIATILLTE